MMNLIINRRSKSSTYIIVILVSLLCSQIDSFLLPTSSSHHGKHKMEKGIGEQQSELGNKQVPKSLNENWSILALTFSSFFSSSSSLPPTLPTTDVSTIQSQSPEQQQQQQQFSSESTDQITTQESQSKSKSDLSMKERVFFTILGSSFGVIMTKKIPSSSTIIDNDDDKENKKKKFLDLMSDDLCKDQKEDSISSLLPSFDSTKDVQMSSTKTSTIYKNLPMLLPNKKEQKVRMEEDLLRQEELIKMERQRLEKQKQREEIGRQIIVDQLRREMELRQKNIKNDN